MHLLGLSKWKPFLYQKELWIGLQQLVMHLGWNQKMKGLPISYLRFTDLTLMRELSKLDTESYFSVPQDYIILTASIIWMA